MSEDAMDSAVPDSEASLSILLHEIFEQYDEFHHSNSFLCAAFESLIFQMNFHTNFLDDAAPNGATTCCRMLQQQSNEIKAQLDRIKAII